MKHSSELEDATQKKTPYNIFWSNMGSLSNMGNTNT